jgi:hypothetical protein
LTRRDWPSDLLINPIHLCRKEFEKHFHLSYWWLMLQKFRHPK